MRWKIASLAGAREAETHGKDGDSSRVVEDFGRQAKLFAQPLATGVGKGHAGFMDLAAWRLSRHQDPSLRMQLQNGPRTQREVL